MSEQQDRAGKDAAPGVELHFTLEPGDYVQAVRAFLRRDARVWITLGLVGIILIGSIANLATAGQATLLSMVLLLVPVMLVAYLWWGWPALVGRRVQRDRRFRSPTTCQVGDEQLVLRNVLGESSLAWAAFHRVVEIKGHYLLVFADNRHDFVLVPRRAFASVEQEAAFRAIVARHLPGLRDPSVFH